MQRIGRGAWRRGRWWQQVRRMMSTTTFQEVQKVPLSKLAHQGKVKLQVADSAVTTVQVIPTLSSDEFALHVLCPEGNALSKDLFEVQEEHSQAQDDSSKDDIQSVRITNSGPLADMPIQMKLVLPHLVDMDFSIVKGSVDLEGKFEGNAKVVLGSGDIAVDKIRGTNVSFKTKDGQIRAKSLIEGENVTLASKGITCKRLMAADCDIKIGKGALDTSFGAIYTSTCSINTESSGSFDVDNAHGYLRVTAEDLASASVHSVSGTLDLQDSGDRCKAIVHFDSVPFNSRSSIHVGGDVQVSVSPTTSEMEVECHGAQVETSSCNFYESNVEELDEDYHVFHGSLRTEATSNANSGASGKINVDGAKESAMRTSFFMTDAQDADEGEWKPRLIAHSTRGNVVLEQLDWMAKLKRRHLQK